MPKPKLPYKLHKGIAYFPSYDAAREVAVAHGLSLNRIRLYDRGWAIQYRVSGPYWPEEETTVKKNPALVVFGNPKRMRARSFQRPVGTLAGEIGEVYAVVYRHTETGELMVHGFGPDGEDIELKSLRDGVQITRMNVNAPTGTYMYAVEDRGRRTVRLAHVEGESLWDNF